MCSEVHAAQVRAGRYRASKGTAGGAGACTLEGLSVQAAHRKRHRNRGRADHLANAHGPSCVAATRGSTPLARQECREGIGRQREDERGWRGIGLGGVCARAEAAGAGLGFTAPHASRRNQKGGKLRQAGDSGRLPGPARLGRLDCIGAAWCRVRALATNCWGPQTSAGQGPTRTPR